MFRKPPRATRLQWVVLLVATCVLASGCGKTNTRKTSSNDVTVTGLVDDGGANTVIPGASCRFINDAGSNVGPVIADATGRFTLRVPKNATGRIECTPPGSTATVLVARVAAGTIAKDVGMVDPTSTLIAAALETEIDDGDVLPANVDSRVSQLGADADLLLIAAALDLVVDALLDAGLDADLLELVYDLADNGELDTPSLAAIAGAVNAAIDAAVDVDDLTIAIANYVDLLFGDEPLVTQAKLLIEHNATDEDTGFQGFGDGDPWNRLTISGPVGPVVVVTPQGGLAGFGLTELFFETSEPPNADVSIAEVLARLGAGRYGFTGDLVDGDVRTRRTDFTHDIPAGPVLLTPIDGSGGHSPLDLVISWEGVTKTIDGGDAEIVGYQVIVSSDLPPAFPSGFAEPLFNVYLPASARSVTVPNGFLDENGSYSYEVLAVEASGNQTLSSAEFDTGDGAEFVEPPESEVPIMKVAKLLIEHNATDHDTGFQGFGDGDPWNQLTIRGPGGETIVQAAPHAGLFDFGLTEFFFETSEPPNAEVSIAEVLARLPEGTYTFTGEMVGGGSSTVITEFTHTIPSGPVLVTPSSDVDANPLNTIVTWLPVTTDLEGSTTITIVGYQVIVELDEVPAFPSGFAKPVFSIYLPADATQVKVPPEFMQAGSDYEFEVLAIELSGNQTLAGGSFSTK